MITRYFESKEKRKKPESQKLIEHYERMVQLKENIGKRMIIRSKDFIYLFENQLREKNRELTGKILEVDNDWSKLEYESRKLMKGNRFNHFLFRTDNIQSLSIAIDSDKR